MHWQKLVRASELFRESDKGKDPDRFYDAHMAQRNPAEWELDEGPGDTEIKLLFIFLNQWGTHYPNDERSRACFKNSYKEVLPRLKRLEGYDLMEAPFEARVADGKTLSEIIQEVFETLASAGGKPYKSTGTSKILHVLQPRLFVMWDSAIRGGYAVSETSNDYARLFLPRVQRELREAVDSYVTENQSEPRTAVQELEKRGGGRPITKLLDEYNYCKFTLRCPKLWE
jgi:hypothetical protein